MLPTLDLPAKDKFMFDLLSIYEMKEDIANNAAAIAELHPDTTTTKTSTTPTTTTPTTTSTTTTTTTTTATTTTTTITITTTTTTKTTTTKSRIFTVVELLQAVLSTLKSLGMDHTKF